ncbi:group-specific protein [Alkalicoccobacillus murimartini]|uniref:Group-specific protein n=1 Tax=Alkalicoccobacillus murimartini TaxID=171685 RepID=A0ABT9YHM2_9BACI|nr:group-specific protein [Alkalicoccobacillus murimartini]MDQ0207366.1 hypothetical protein [Alkalicoccobacillus murimartini]
MYDWTEGKKVHSVEQLSLIGEQEKEAVKQSDFLVLLYPAGKSSHVELGIALGLGKRIYLYSPTNEVNEIEKTSTFYHVEGVDRYIGEFEDFMQYLVGKETMHI